MDRVLLLSADWQPITICTWRRAVSLMLRDKVEIIEANERKLSVSIALPSVIRLKHVVPVSTLPFACNRHNILMRDQHRCQYCGSSEGVFTLDHVYPKSRGGKRSWDNLVTACSKCNEKKRDRTPEEAEMPLLSLPSKPVNKTDFLLRSYRQRQDPPISWLQYFANSA